MQSLIRLASFGLLILAASSAAAIDVYEPKPKTATGQQVKLLVQEIGVVGPYKLVRVSVEGADPKALLKWRVSPKKGVDRATTPRGLLEFVAPPGTYDIDLEIITINAAGDLEGEEHSVSVVIAPCCPPKPIDPPVVPPAPPKGGKLDAPAALAKIYFAPYGCTATVIGPRRPDGKWDLVSAAHCIAHVGVGSKGSAKLPDGREFKIVVTALDKASDVSWLVTDDVIEDMPYANLASENPPVGTKVWHAGYGVDKPGNREEGVVTQAENSDGQLKFSLSVSSGDSGGGIFRADTNELVATVCCTLSRGSQATMWGGSVKRARALRPKSTQAEFTWEPIPMPLVEIRP